LGFGLSVSWFGPRGWEVGNTHPISDIAMKVPIPLSYKHTLASPNIHTFGSETQLLALVTVNERPGSASESWGSLCVGRQASRLRVFERSEAQTCTPDPGEGVLRMCSVYSWVCSDVAGEWRRIPADAVLYLTLGKGVLRRYSLSVQP